MVFHRDDKNENTILIVDDEMVIAHIIAELVKEMGYVPLIAYNGRDALMLLQQRYPRLLVMDYMMPYMNGAKLVEQVHEQGFMMPIILITAATCELARQTPVAALIQKPFTLDEIELLIGLVMRQR